jgi:hypothetical protein
MLKILRQLTPEEMRRVALLCRARGGATPDEVIRSLARLCGVTTWGIFPAGTDDVLLDHVGRRLGMAPLAGGPHAILMRERAILACYLRQAWADADAERREAVLNLALALWDSPGAARPMPAEAGDEVSSTHPTLEVLLHGSAGCRALAAATETEPLPLFSTRPLSGLPAFTVGRAFSGHQSLYEVLLILWRARARILRERRAQRSLLERQTRQAETLLAVRRQDLVTAPLPWGLNPASGLSVIAAATVSVAVNMALGAADPLALIPAAVAATAGLAWSSAALAFRPRPSRDRRVSRISLQAQSLRSQLVQVERAVRSLEAE